MKKVKIDEGGARRFLETLEEFINVNSSSNDIRNIQKNGKHVVTVLTNGKMEPRFCNWSAAIHFFGEPIKKLVVRLSELSAFEKL